MNANPMQAALAAVKSQSDLARKLGVSHTAVRKWLLAGKPPVLRVLALETITGVSRYQLRPDIYPPEDRAEQP